MGSASLFLESMQPAMNVVATAPRPGKKTASLPFGGAMRSGCFMDSRAPTKNLESVQSSRKHDDDANRRDSRRRGGVAITSAHGRKTEGLGRGIGAAHPRS